MIDIGDLSFAFDDRPVFRDISIRIERGERLALVGANGTGKTTLLRLVAGLLEPDAGSVRVDGSVGFAPEDPQTGLFAASVADEVAFFPRNRGLDVETAVSAAIDRMALTGFEDRNPFSLSVGEQRRLSIASVLSGDPAVLCLDEPTKGIDRRGARDLATVITDLDKTIVFSTHDTDFAYEVSDRVAILAEESIRRLGSVEGVLGDESLLVDAGVRPPGLVELARREGFERLPGDIEEALEMLGGGA